MYITWAATSLPGRCSTVQFQNLICLSILVHINGNQVSTFYRVKQNLGKQVLRIPCPKFCSPSSSFVVFIHEQRDLSSLPWIGGAAVQISWAPPFSEGSRDPEEKGGVFTLYPGFAGSETGASWEYCFSRYPPVCHQQG